MDLPVFIAWADPLLFSNPDSMFAIYYPYFAGPSKWEELRYSLRSIEKNLYLSLSSEKADASDYEVWLVGDKPDWIQNVRHLPVSSLRGVVNECLRDTNRKFMSLLEHEDCPEYIVRMHDDVYLINEVTLTDLCVTRYLFREGLNAVGDGAVRWRDQVNRTCSFLKERDFTTMMCETHCPELYCRDIARQIFKACDLEKNVLLPATLYFNIKPHRLTMMDRKVQRALFYGFGNSFSFKSVDVEHKVQGKLFLNHNDMGLNDELKAFLEKSFPEKSRFEK